MQSKPKLTKRTWRTEKRRQGGVGVGGAEQECESLGGTPRMRQAEWGCVKKETVEISKYTELIPKLLHFLSNYHLNFVNSAHSIRQNKEFRKTVSLYMTNFPNSTLAVLLHIQ